MDMPDDLRCTLCKVAFDTSIRYGLDTLLCDPRDDGNVAPVFYIVRAGSYKYCKGAVSGGCGCSEMTFLFSVASSSDRWTRIRTHWSWWFACGSRRLVRPDYCS